MNEEESGTVDTVEEERRWGTRAMLVKQIL